MLVLVVLCPPFAVLLTAPPSQALKNLGLTLLFYIPGVLHARSVVETYRVHRKYDSLMRVLESRAVSVPARQVA